VKREKLTCAYPKFPFPVSRPTFHASRFAPHDSRLTIPVPKMPLLDFILNLAGLLLWLGWRSTRFDPLVRTSVSSLAGTLRRAEPQRLKGWQFLSGLIVLVIIRALFYWQIGSAVSWSLKLDLVAVVPNFRGYHFLPAMVFSVLSLARMLGIFYFWLLFLVMINRRPADSDPVLKMLRLHVGRAARWPWPIQLFLPLLLVTGLWMAVHPLLMQVGATNPVSSYLCLFEQGLLIGGGLYLSLKFLIPAFLLLHLIASYVYLGASPFWDFVGATAGSFLRPLHLTRLRFGRWDLAPLVGTGLVLLLLHWIPKLIAGYLAFHKLTIWPQ
jgi:uncharacterized protein YggT (Ycf19 family)